jgi:hypothetical protein
MRLFFLVLGILLAPAETLADQDKITPVGNYQVPDDHTKFIKEFLGLMKQNPDAARRFGLVDMGAEQPVSGVIIWTCEDFGGSLIPPECKPELLQ